MIIDQIERHFRRIGARAKIHQPSRWVSVQGLAIDIGQDGRGEFFDITAAEPGSIDTLILDCQPQLRHLLLMSHVDGEKQKFLCGHDERHWFVAAVPEKAAVSTVRTAFDALKPTAVRVREVQVGVKARLRNRRRTAAFIRQGEWFFVPVANQKAVDTRLVLHNEPISRGRGKPHMCEDVVRQGGELVYVCNQFPAGLSESHYQLQLKNTPHLRNQKWVVQRRNPTVFVRGRVKHPDHKTIVLDGWHEVLMNTEHQASAMRHVAFLD